MSAHGAPYSLVTTSRFSSYTSSGSTCVSVTANPSSSWTMLPDSSTISSSRSDSVVSKSADVDVPAGPVGPAGPAGPVGPVAPPPTIGATDGLAPPVLADCEVDVTGLAASIASQIRLMATCIEWMSVLDGRCRLYGFTCPPSAAPACAAIYAVLPPFRSAPCRPRWSRSGPCSRCIAASACAQSRSPSGMLPL